jgi:putative glutamine amidotransferase
MNGLYVSSLTEAGSCTPVMLPIPQYTDIGRVDAIAKNYAEMIDGLLLSGGGDVDAVFFDEENHTYNGCFSPIRDAFEIALCKYAVGAGLPILGICRGVQLINVAMGGTLFQDIAAQNPAQPPVAHNQKSPGAYPSHYINIYGGSLLASILETDITGRIRVNSHHHQAVKDVAPGFKICATADDGIIEAIEIADVRPEAGAADFILGVQWHPERMAKYHGYARIIFEKFISSCRHSCRRPY